MTSRRSFFKSLSLIADAASASPLIFLPKLEPVKWKAIKCHFTDSLIYMTPAIDEDIIDFRELYGRWDFIVDPPMTFYETELRASALEKELGRKLTYDEWFTGRAEKSLAFL